MKVLVIVHSPLQLINVNEYLILHNIQECEIDFVFFNIAYEKEVYQLVNTFNLLSLKGRILRFNCFGAHTFKNVISKLKMFIKLKIFIRTLKKTRYNLVICGDINSINHSVLCNVTNAKCVYVDDGNVIHTVLERIKNGKPSYIFSNTKTIIYKALGFNVDLKYHKGFIYLFTIYYHLKIPNHPYIKFEENGLVNLKLKIGNKERSNQVIYFIGSSLITNNFIDFSYFINLINKINNYYSGKQIVYFQHRNENRKVLDIVKNAGWLIENEEVAIELHILQKDIIPLEFGMFFSSASDTIFKLVQNVNFTSFKLNSNEIKNNRNNIEFIYKEYESNNRIQLIDL